MNTSHDISDLGIAASNARARSLSTEQDAPRNNPEQVIRCCTLFSEQFFYRALLRWWELAGLDQRRLADADRTQPRALTIVTMRPWTPSRCQSLEKFMTQYLASSGPADASSMAKYK